MTSEQQKAPELVYSNDGEIYRFEDLRDLVDCHELKAGDVVHVGEKLQLPASAYIDADSIIDQMGERAMDEAGEAADGFPDVNKEARSELKRILAEWADKHCPVHFFPVVNAREYLLTQQDIEDA